MSSKSYHIWGVVQTSKDVITFWKTFSPVNFSDYRTNSVLLFLLVRSGLVIWSGLKTWLSAWKLFVLLTASVPQLARLSWNERNELLPDRLHTRQKQIPEMFNWPVSSGLEIFWNKLSSAVHVVADFPLFSLLNLFPSCMLLQPSRSLDHFFKFITTSIPLLLSLHLHSVFLQVFQACLKIFCQTLIWR